MLGIPMTWYEDNGWSRRMVWVVVFGCRGTKSGRKHLKPDDALGSRCFERQDIVTRVKFRFFLVT